MNKPELNGICVLVDGGCLNNNKAAGERKMYGSLTVFHNGKQVESTTPHYSEKQFVHHIKLNVDGDIHNAQQPGGAGDAGRSGIVCV